MNAGAARSCPAVARALCLLRNVQTHNFIKFYYVPSRYLNCGI